MSKKAENFSLLDQGSVFEGTLSFTGKAVIKGTVKGILKGEFITIGEEGIVEADTNADTLIIGGRFRGKAEVRGQLSILSKGNCEGEIRCGDLVIEPGGMMNARVTNFSPAETSPSAQLPAPEAKKKRVRESLTSG
ncbi:MAG: polymer-forming cytoskeletal protein [Desulfococcaceae bacterium]